MTASFRRFSGACGILAGLSGLIYLVSFFITRNPAELAHAPKRRPLASAEQRAEKSSASVGATSTSTNNDYPSTAR